MEGIESGFGAITIDNATFKGEGYKFYEGLLAQMRQFKDSPVKVIQTDIVHYEAIKHIGQDIAKARSSIDQALRSASKQLKLEKADIEAARSLLSINGHENEVAAARLDDYYEYIGVQRIESKQYIDLDVLMQMYFDIHPPFESGKDKKNEFPDAIALLALEGWAEENNTTIMAVSPDKAWKDYAATSARITVVSSLAEALEKFQPYQKVASIIDHIREDALLERKNHIVEAIESAIKASINGDDIWIDANSYLHFECKRVSAAYLSHEFDRDRDGLVKIRIIRIDDGSIVLKVATRVEVEVEADFDFFVHDTIGDDNVSMGENTCTTHEAYHTDVLITLVGDFAKIFDAIDVEAAEILETIRHADFGDIEPDWRNEYEEPELE